MSEPTVVDELIAGFTEILDELTGEVSPEKMAKLKASQMEVCPQCGNWPPHREWCTACNQMGFRRLGKETHR